MPPALSQAQTTGARAADHPLATVKYWNNHKKQTRQMQRASSCCPSAHASSSGRDVGCRRAGPSSEINEARHAPSGPSVPACPTAGTELGPLPLLAPQQFINCLFVYLKAHTVCAAQLGLPCWGAKGVGGGECLETWGSLSHFLSCILHSAGSAGRFINARSMAAKSQL